MKWLGRKGKGEKKIGKAWRAKFLSGAISHSRRTDILTDLQRMKGGRGGRKERGMLPQRKLVLLCALPAEGREKKGKEKRERKEGRNAV